MPTSILHQLQSRPTTPDNPLNDERAVAAKAALLLQHRETGFDFPVEAFPEGLQTIIGEWHRCYLLPLDYFGTGVLVAASAVTGNGFAVEYRYRHLEVPILYAALVGSPGLGKTPAINICLAPIFRFEEEYRADYRRQLQRWKQECLDNEQANGKQPDPPKPVCREVIINDATIEAINHSLNNNPRGLLYFRDELNAWLNSMNQYRKGSDTEFWLSNWSNVSTKVSRVGKEPIYIKQPFLSVIGGIQPRVLHTLAANGKSDNGFLARMLFAYPKDQDIPPESNATAHREVFDEYRRILRYLHELPINITPPESGAGPGTVEPIALQISNEGRTIYRDFVERVRLLTNGTEEETLRGLYIKMKSHCLRFALLLELLDLACRDELVDRPHLEAELFITPESMQRAILLSDYFLKTALRVIERFDSPVNQLAPRQRALYEALPESFKRSVAMHAGKELTISESTIKRLLNDSIYFKRLGGGFYEKKLV